MKSFFLIPFLFFSCSVPGEAVKTPNAGEKQQTILPVALSFSKSVPDSIRDFVKVYMQTKDIKVITFEESLKLIGEQGKDIFMKNLPTENERDKEYVDRFEKLRKPVYNLLRAEMFSQTTNTNLLVDSIKWFVLQKVSTDTIKKYHTFYPLARKEDNPFLLWRAFADTVLASGLLK